ncbi:YveK family protein [Anaerocolumna sp. MB42-C2]|uniref:YveK family protein n=1 Tax=Anaerocolumna sp. MB42-C2 TaxID=3070997 RepID=UPI0027DF9773|nr:Wzz/FepE/Etk N-terminal domain-containing protein [Anaerocolumna sp. MB42-C2]WMJ85794.1 Wzz/FepE/Etk N-terminal domain-containing protein [Anaerocolumna sp. MB42-C2]
MEKDNRDEIEIDLKELFFVLLDKVWIIVFAGIICALSAGIFTKILLKPVYESTTKIYVINRQDSEKFTTYSDLQTGTQLTKDYQVLVKSRPVTEQVISDLNLNMTHEELSNAITVTTPTDTRILEITVKYSDPYIAKKLADSIGEVSSERMVSIMEMEKANIVEPGNIPAGPSSPDFKKNVIMGGAAGIVLSIFAILLIYLLDDTVKKSEDIEKYLGLTTLGTIPIEESILESKKVKAARKKAYKKAYKKGYKGGVSNASY